MSNAPLTLVQVLAGYLVAVLTASVTGGLAALVSGDEESVLVLATGQLGFWAGLGAVVAFARRRSEGRTNIGGTRVGVRVVDMVGGVAVGVITQLILLPALYLPFRGFFEDDALSAPAENLIDRVDGFGLVVMGLGVVIVAPIVEELYFRGLLLRTIEQRWGVVVAVVGSSLFFGATHFQLLQLPGLTLAGLVFAMAVVRTGRIGAAIAVHIGFNATTFALLTVLG
ncbi:MAG: type II CAAX endopeptidase family protein [Acidimicrobiales bacterium]|nr:type II CAAX endopeptidase family protein [Acidimicrobiales bacterium]